MSFYKDALLHKLQDENDKLKKEKKAYRIKVNLTEEDLYRLQRGEDFHWSWNTEEDENVIINIHLFQAEEDFGDDEEEEE